MEDQQNSRTIALKRILALGVFAALVYWGTTLWPQVREELAVSLSDGGWVGLIMRGESLLFIAGVLFELIFAAVILRGVAIAQAEPPTQGESDAANVFIFILLTLAAIIGEFFLFLVGAPLGLPGWIFVLLVLLMSILTIYGTAIWLWTQDWIRARRNICMVVIPLIATWLMALYDTVVACLNWSIQRYSECAAWGTKTSTVCTHWGTRTSTSCRNWGTSTTKTCTSWMPVFLGFLCLIWNVVVQIICLLWQVIVTVICLLWLIIVQLVCLAFIIIMILVCLAWALIVVVLALVLMLVIVLLRIIFFC